MQGTFGRGDRPGDDITPISDVEGHGVSYRGLGDEPEVEGHVVKYRGRDAEGNEFDIPEDRIISVSWRDAEGEHEVEGHWVRVKLDQEPEVEGHSVKYRYSDDQGQEHEVDAHSTRIKFRDDNGEEQEVEGHYFRYSDLGLKRHVEPLRDALARLREVGA
jgi:hypothetical protein